MHSPRHFLLSKHTWIHICSTYHSLQFDCITDCFCTDPSKPLVLHTPVYVFYYYITARRIEIRQHLIAKVMFTDRQTQKGQ